METDGSDADAVPVNTSVPVVALVALRLQFL